MPGSFLLISARSGCLSILEAIKDTAAVFDLPNGKNMKNLQDSSPGSSVEESRFCTTRLGVMALARVSLCHACNNDVD